MERESKGKHRDIKSAALTEGYHWSYNVEIFLERYGYLKIVFELEGRPHSFHFDSLKAMRDIDSSWITEDYSARLQTETLCVIGQAYQDHLTLMMNDKGFVFGGYDDELFFLGKTGEEAIENICLNVNVIKID